MFERLSEKNLLNLESSDRSIVPATRLGFACPEKRGDGKLITRRDVIYLNFVATKGCNARFLPSNGMKMQIVRNERSENLEPWPPPLPPPSLPLWWSYRDVIMLDLVRCIAKMKNAGRR